MHARCPVACKRERLHEIGILVLRRFLLYID